MARPELEPTEIYYPESDGKPMAESDLHRRLMVELIEGAQFHFREAPDVYVSGNLLVYFEKGNRWKVVSPDFFVVLGVEKKERPIYKVWEEGKGPDVVVEVTSPSTHREDLGKKRRIYEALGVVEYFLYDPQGIRFRPQLQGFRRERGTLLPIAAEDRGEGLLVLQSRVLGLELHVRGSWARWVGAGSGVPLPSSRADWEQLAAAAEERVSRERERREAEAARADAAEAELARLREAFARKERESGGSRGSS